MKWPHKRLSELSEVITKGTTPTSLGFSYTSSGIRFLRAQNINYGNVNFFDDDLYIDGDTHKALARSQILNGDLLVSIAGSIGRSGIVISNNEKLNCNQAVAIVRIKKENNVKYISYALDSQHVKDQITNSTVTGVISNLSLSQLGNLKIPLPPLEEQQRIVAVLDAAARILKLRESAIAKLDQLAQTFFAQMTLDKKNCIAIKKLGEICDVRDGTHNSPKYVNEGMPLITSKNLTHGSIDLSDVNLISTNDFVEINKRSKVDYDDILMPMIGTIGNPVIVKDQNPKFAIKNVALIKQISGSPNSIYLKAVLEGESFKSYVRKISRGGTQKFLGLNDIRNFEIAVMNKRIEDKFVNFIKNLNNMRDLYSLNSVKQNEMLASLQHQSFALA
jgi:type I restriction enzyme S subunit